MVSAMEFDEIFDAYHPRILRFLTKIVGPHDAEDVTQEVFDKISRRLNQFQGKSKLSTWIYRIAANTAIDRTRSAASKEETTHESGLSPKAPRSPVTDRLVIRKEMSDCINEFVDKLPPDYRTVIVLSDLEGFTNKEIAEILGISLDNVKIRRHRARAKLKKALEAGCEFYYSEDNTLACDRKPIQIQTKPQ
jgi:RNA polymerase sigma-70 factor (ECF subfamily)